LGLARGDALGYINLAPLGLARGDALGYINTAPLGLARGDALGYSLQLGPLSFNKPLRFLKPWRFCPKKVITPGALPLALIILTEGAAK
jgi:hypothetical protein